MSFYSLMFLAQALGATDLQTTVQIAVVSNNLHQVAGEPILRPSRALIAGPCGVIPRELADARCINIDVELSGGDDLKEAAEQVIAELQMRSTESPVAYRKNRRYVQAFARLRKQEKQPIALRDDGVYLITGGLGAIGLTLAESIAKSTHARIVLVGRSASQSSSDAERIRKIRAIEETGAEVMVVAGDVCDPDAMRRVADQVHARFGPINGIIHTAGILDDAPLLEKDRHRCGTSARAKGSRHAGSRISLSARSARFFHRHVVSEFDSRSCRPVGLHSGQCLPRFFRKVAVARAHSLHFDPMASMDRRRNGRG